MERKFNNVKAWFAYVYRNLKNIRLKTFAGNHLTVSTSRWMELPEMSFDDITTECNRSKKTNHRVTANEVRNYYHEYVKKKHLDKHILNNATVLGVRKLKPSSAASSDNNDICDLWEVFGTISCSNCNKAKPEKYEFRFGKILPAFQLIMKNSFILLDLKSL